jgi:hypothetical protein
MMKQVTAMVLLLIGYASADAQQYRMNYDESTIPELYYTTEVFLEEKHGSEYEPYRGKYRFSTPDVTMRGNKITYTPQELQRLGGKVNFRVEVKGDALRLPLTLPALTDIRFNLYTDSIKPVLNYFVNVEGVYSSGRIFPLTPDHITLTSDEGSMNGLEWILPKERPFEKVTFTATSRSNPNIRKSVTLYLNKYKDPRDAEGYEERRDPDELPVRRRR